MRAKLWFISLGLAMASACGTISTLDGEPLRRRSEAFRAYMQAVFRAQNRAAVELTFALDDPDLSPERQQRLEAADATLLTACADLNLVAARRRDGRPAGWVRGSRAARQAPLCEQAVRDVLALLEGGDD